MRFVTFEQVAARFRGKRIAVVGSAPSVLENEPGFVDGFDVVVRANNYKLGVAQGYRTDVHYSFYGTSIRKSAADLRRDGVSLCMCKCPDSKPIDCDWHVRNGRINGIDFRYIYRRRRFFWFCDTYIPNDQSFLEKFFLLQKHIPTTGFAALHDILLCEPAMIYVTGFDFFRSRMHNVDERWPVREEKSDDPIRHEPERELAWLRKHSDEYPMSFDDTLEKIITEPEQSEEARVA